jgi:hypothetical protein
MTTAAWVPSRTFATEAEKEADAALVEAEVARLAKVDALRRRVAVVPTYAQPSAPRDTRFHNVRDVTRGQDSARGRRPAFASAPVPMGRPPTPLLPLPARETHFGTSGSVRDVTRGQHSARSRPTTPTPSTTPTLTPAMLSLPRVPSERFTNVRDVTRGATSARARMHGPDTHAPRVLTPRGARTPRERVAV